jgi:hypothetical protein
LQLQRAQLLPPRQEAVGRPFPPALHLLLLLLLQLTPGQAGRTWTAEGLGRQCLRVL